MPFLNAPADPVLVPGITVREISHAEFAHEALGQARLDVPRIRGVHMVPLRGSALDLQLVPMEQPQ